MSSVTSSTTSRTLDNHISQTTWLLRLRRCGVHQADPKVAIKLRREDEQLLARTGSGTAGDGRDVSSSTGRHLGGDSGLTYTTGPEARVESGAGGGGGVDMTGWESIIVEPVLSDSMPSPNRLLNVLHRVFHEFYNADATMKEEKMWTPPLCQLLGEVFGVHEGMASVAVDDCGIHASVLQRIGVPDLIKAIPDAIIGLSSNAIRIAPHRDSSLLIREMAIDFILSRKEPPLFEISGVPTSDHFFSFFLVEMKGPVGIPGKAIIQNRTAMFVSLRVVLDIAAQARDADPQTWKEPNEVMRRVYGLTTAGGGNLWNIDVMVAYAGRSDDSGHGNGQGSGHDVSGEEREDRDVLAWDSFTTTTLWTGNVTEPTQLLTLIPVLLRIKAQVEVRHEYIGNWLYCLRDQVELDNHLTPPKRAKVTRGGRRAGGKKPTVASRNQLNKRTASAQNPVSGGAATGAALVATDQNLTYIRKDLRDSSEKTDWIRSWVSSVTSDSGGARSDSAFADHLEDVCRA